MLPFSTEFPVRASPNRAAFVSEVVGWLRGMRQGGGICGDQRGAGSHERLVDRLSGAGIVQDQTVYAFDRLLGAVHRFRILVLVGDLLQRGPLAIPGANGPCRASSAHTSRARAAGVIAPAEDQPVFRPDDLRADI